MSDKELNVEETKGCCGGHDHEHGCGEDCGCGHEHYETMVVDLEKEDGTIISCEIVDTFEYNGNGYALVFNPEEEGMYLFKEEGEEGELVVPDEAEFEEVTKYYEENVAE
ncbi:MAG: DUF1292 domain-containing protein [Sarcina sp.]